MTLETSLVITTRPLLSTYPSEAWVKLLSSRLELEQSRLCQDCVSLRMTTDNMVEVPIRRMEEEEMEIRRYQEELERQRVRR